MAITLKQAFALNGTPDLTSFKDLQEQCKNTDYFTDSNPINKLSSWEGYWYGTGDYKISLSASTASVAASGGSVTITYTIKQVTSTGDTALSGVKPTITSSLGTVGTLTSTNASGQGTCTITLSSLGCTVKPETTITVTGSYNGASSSATFKQAENSKTTVAWNNPTISTFSYGNIAACSTSATPSISYSQTGTQSYTSGTCTTTVTQNSEATISYSETTAHSAASVHSSTGVVTWGANGKNSSSRSVGITATVSMNGKSVTKSATSTQNADTYTDSTEYGNYKTTATLGNTSPTCSSGTTTLTIKITRQSRTKRVWACGGTEYLSWSADTAYASMPTVTDNVDWLSVGTVSASSTTGTYTATVTYNANSKNTSTRTATITASCNANGTVSLTQGKDSYTDSGGVTSTTYGSWGGGAISFNSTTALSAAADSRTVTIQPWSRTKTVSTTAKIRTWTCGGTETLVAASSNNSTEYYTGTVAVSENGSYTSLSATSYTASSSAKTLTLTKTTCGTTITSAATVTVTANPSTDGPATTTKSISQTANALTNVAISVKSGTTPIPYGGGTVTLQCKGTFTSGTHEVTPLWTGATNGTLSSTTAKNPTLTVGANSGEERDIAVSAKYPNDSTGKIASFTIKQAGVPVSFTLPIDFYVQSTTGVSGAADCSFKCTGEVALGSQSTQTFSFNSGLIQQYYNTSGSFKETKKLNVASLDVITNSTTFQNYTINWGFALHESEGSGTSTSSTIPYKLYWQIEKSDGTIYELLSTDYPKISTNYVSVHDLTINESQTQTSHPTSVTDGDRIRVVIVI